MVKQQLRKAARSMADWPIVGRLVHIVAALNRLPALQAAYLDLNHRQYVLEKQQEQMLAMRNMLLHLNHNWHIFETQQLPTLIAGNNDTQNLIKSAPITFRKITRDLLDIHRELESVSNSFDQRVEETKGRVENVSSSVDHLLSRIEFIRTELMFEMRYGATKNISKPDQIETKPEIINKEKLATAKEETLRLNLGCGHIPLNGYLNIDQRALPGVDIVAQVNELPFAGGEVDEIFSAHLLEHFPQEQLRRQLLPYWVSLLKSGGVLRSVVPDAETMIKRYSEGTFPYSSLREVTFGGQDYDGDFHFNMFLPEQLEGLLTEAGLSDFEWLARGRANGACYEMEIKAVKK